jgi:hypothetical protein
VIAELLDLFSSGAWDRLEDGNKETFLRKLETDFHIRAWDDWDWKADSAYSRVAALVAAEIKGMKRKIP